MDSGATEMRLENMWTLIVHNCTYKQNKEYSIVTLNMNDLSDI
jgi:hypothetical protein